jgi:hypothetical protein
MSERTSDQEFVRVFSPRVLERLADDAFDGAVHIFRSPPGGGKTTLLRAFTPPALKSFWNARTVEEIDESYKGLLSRGVFDAQLGPQLLGVFLSCASGYADLPPGASGAQEGLFRALLNCRIVLRALRSLSLLVMPATERALNEISISYNEPSTDLYSIPRLTNAAELSAWAETRERDVYDQLDSVRRSDTDGMQDPRLDGLLWLQNAQFKYRGITLAPKRLIMIDDLHRLRRSQRLLLLRESAELRPAFPVWLAERNIVLGDELLSQGVREGRDLREYKMEDLWGNSKSGTAQTVSTFSQILDRRLHIQNVIPPGTFGQYLSDQLIPSDLNKQFDETIVLFNKEKRRLGGNPRYSEWLASMDTTAKVPSSKSISDLFSLLILIARDESRRQMALQLEPLSPEELDQRDSSQVQGAAEILANQFVGLPYYYNIERLCAMATNNVEELLSLAAALYDGLRAKLVLRRSDLLLSAAEQERLLRAAAKRKRDFIPKAHTEGTRAARLLDSIGSFCRERTFLPTAPYAPGVTGIRFSQSELAKIRQLQAGPIGPIETLRKVIAESVAENLLVTRDSAPSTNREGGTVFYLNRTLCVHYGLPLQYGGWQDVSMHDAIDWMERGRIPKRTDWIE